MASEAPPQSIQERIAALNQSQVGRVPGASPPPRPLSKPALPARPPLPQRNKTVNVPVRDVHGSVTSNNSTRNQLRSRDLLPPPVIIRTGQQTADSVTTTTAKKPPPLPVRKKPSQPSPALPLRRSSDFPIRKNSSDSSFSVTSISTSSTRTDKSPSRRSTSREPTGKRALAPAWGDATIPPLPLKRSETEKPVAGTLRQTPKANSIRKVSTIFVPETKPKLPTRPPSNRVTDLPTLASLKSSSDEPIKPTPRKIPPPAPSAATLEKAKALSFATLKSHIQEDKPHNGPQSEPQRDLPPPPVPLSSRPDLSKIQATKPSFAPSPPNQHLSATMCLRCRDFSGPDTHATKFPRESLPTHDLAWLAMQLTAPFPSYTDKARVLFVWLHHNIYYDVDAFFGNRVQPSTPASTFSTGLAVCEGYAALFATLATHAGLEAHLISGHGKGFGHQALAPGSPVPTFKSNHAWNVVRIDGGQWKLIDTCWGSGNVSGAGQPYNKQFSPDHFTMSNSEFLLRHYPSNKSHFYTDDGRPGMSWEEYILTDASNPGGIEPPTVYDGAESDNGIGKKTFEPASKTISINQPGPLRFQFGLICPHWTLEQHSKIHAPYIFFLSSHGIDGRKKEYLAFQHVAGTGPGGGGDVWYIDVADPRVLGAPGQSLMLYAVKTFGPIQDARGLSRREFLDGVGRKAMSFVGIAEWKLVA
ncbi:hypothetical protein AJ80_09487 [Polytolypa hystricis UAMH7299]|uniref:Transglutaminase-like domain-containing protein n=1 Tax=Polytolypa hystricis (strain UAMH7299) TaxID=1447883 RepID=A0A2B7WPY9_POLH7|nr:hypothetical protein AJ80_09487 [Polytolypa hystricis UAMH7299]